MGSVGYIRMAPMGVQKRERQIIEERRVKARDAVNTALSIFDFLAEHKITPNAHHAISCPFHGNDEDPSLGITQDGHGFNCFGCGAKGGYIKFRTLWEQKVEGKETNYNEVLEKILQENPSVCEELGFSSIFSEIISDIQIEHDQDGRLILPKRPEKNYQRVKTATIKSIFDKLTEIGDILSFIEFVQKGNREEYILKLYSGPEIKSILPTEEIIAGLDALLNGQLEDAGIDDVE